jgi:hypothetical protein
MATPTLQDLLTPRDQPTIESTLLASLQAAPIVGGAVNSFPVTDWAPGGFDRTHIKMTATGFVDRENIIQILTAAGYLDLAATITDSSGNLVEGWSELLAAQGFDIPRGVATFAQQALVLTCTSGPGPYSRNPGELVAYSPSTGNRYANVAALTIPNGGSVTATFQAQSPGAGYQDAANTIISMVTPLPGVSVNNPVTVAGVPAATINGTGSIAVTSTGITGTPRVIELDFVTAGRVSDSSAQFICKVYTGNQITTSAVTNATATFAQSDITLTLTDGALGTQSFQIGDSWIVAVPGTPMIQAGSDEETIAQLTQECHDRWPSLSDVPTQGRIEGQVFACSKAQGLGLTKVLSAASTTVAGVENVYIAGSAATATPAQVAAVQSWLNARQSEIESIAVAAATAHPLAPSGVVQCHRGQTAAVQAAADTAWVAYLAALPIGGSAPGHLVEIAVLTQVLKDAGAYNVSLLQFFDYLLGAPLAIGADMVLGASEVATLGAAGKPSQGLTWQEVA